MVRKILIEVCGIVELEGEEGLQACEGGEVERLRVDIVAGRKVGGGRRKRGGSRGIIDIAWLSGAEWLLCLFE